MRIYTGTGDGGETGLFGGARVSKDDGRMEACGTVDETNAALGLARSLEPSPSVDAVLDRVQAELFVVGAEIACVRGHEARLKLRLIAQEHVHALERDIDGAEQGLAKLSRFVVPGGCPVAAALHLARTVCRRAERRIISLERDGLARRELGVYLNRLGDLLFVLARVSNTESGRGDQLWAPER
ncbi:MAG: cob(I)yrinic acid a,c-diamide adenosyltransferase [Polyangiaceae bacterium]|nr:cob(I)yrinic acid a,c-diamide adenosyltransferase [Polyangiaceae bacterium]